MARKTKGGRKKTRRNKKGGGAATSTSGSSCPTPSVKDKLLEQYLKLQKHQLGSTTDLELDQMELAYYRDAAPMVHGYYATKISGEQQELSEIVLNSSNNLDPLVRETLSLHLSTQRHQYLYRQWLLWRLVKHPRYMGPSYRALLDHQLLVVRQQTQMMARHFLVEPQENVANFVYLFMPTLMPPHQQLRVARLILNQQQEPYVCVGRVVRVYRDNQTMTIMMPYHDEHQRLPGENTISFLTPLGIRQPEKLDISLIECMGSFSSLAVPK